MEAIFYFPTTTTLTLLVGGAGGGGAGGGGGGGSFVVKGNMPLVIAGGGGGGGSDGYGGSGLTNSAGGGISGGTGGNGGGACEGGGGGGFYSGGGGLGGSSYLSGGAGGAGGVWSNPDTSFTYYGGTGGYGGGAGGMQYGGTSGGGGGGGYSGGGGGCPEFGGGGGGSFINSSAIAIATELSGVRSGNGEIDIVAVTSVFFSQPGSRTNDAGTTATFRVLAAGPPPLSYQWRKDGAPLVDGGNVAGSGMAVLTLANVLGADAGGYSVVVSNGLGSATSAVATLTVIDPAIAVQPVSQLAQPGQTATLSVTAAGTAPFAFQWWKEGVALAWGTGASLTLTNLQAPDAGDYSVVVSNQYGSVASAVALLAVNLATLDSGFNPGPNNGVSSLAVQADGKILVGGWFTTMGGQSCNCVGRLNADGTLDSGFNAGPFEGNVTSVNGLAVQVDGKIVVGGWFTTLGGQARNNIARLNADGTLDSAFNLGADCGVYPLAAQAEGKILVGGCFTTLGGQSRNYLGRLNSDGTLDTGFNPGANNDVYSLAVQADGEILVGGSFTMLDGQTRNYIGRLNADGSLDRSFNPGAVANLGAFPGVTALVVQADGKILVGGSFTTLGGQPCNCLGRLNADGTLDTGFNPGPVGGGPYGGVRCLALQADGKILVGGGFTNLCGQPCNYLGRLNADGTLDSGFNPGPGPVSYGGSVQSLAVQSDGKILVGGDFTTLGGQSRNCIGRLNNTEPATQSLGYDGSTITWLRGGASPEVWRTTFDFSTNGTDWASLGAGARTAGLPAGQAGGWQLTNTSLPSATGTIRARGYVTGGQYDGSTWFVESDLQVPSAASPPPVILVNDPSFGFSSNRFGFEFSGTAGQVVIVETSTNLASWTSVATNTLAATPSYFSDPYSGSFPQKFYRLRVGP